MNRSAKVLVLLRSEEGASGLEFAVIMGIGIVSVVFGLAFLGNSGAFSSNSASKGYAVASLGKPSFRRRGLEHAARHKDEGGSSLVPSPLTMFDDSFDDPEVSAVKWDFNSSSWRVNNGVLQAGPDPSSNSICAYAIGSTATNPTITVTATLNEGAGYGVLFDLSGDPIKQNVNGYSLHYDSDYGSGAFTLSKYVNGVQILLPLVVVYPGALYQWLGTPKQITITQQGSLITAQVDGRTVLTCVDNSYASGGVGLRCWNSASATFQNFSVSSASR
jgi:Flp pilus assembly pilin Flp